MSIAELRIRLCQMLLKSKQQAYVLYSDEQAAYADGYEACLENILALIEEHRRPIGGSI